MEAINGARLAGGWGAILRDCRELGPLLIYNQNPGACLAARRFLPELLISQDETWAADEQRQLALDFTEWLNVVALDKPEPPELSVLNERCRRQFGLGLIHECQRSWFRDIIGTYRASAAGGIPACVSSAGAVGWKQYLNTRAARLMDAEQSFLPTSNRLRQLLEGALQNRLRLRTGVCSGAAYLRHCWTLDEVGCSTLGLWARDRDAVLQVFPSELHRAWIVQGPCACCQEDHWALEVYNAEGRLRLMLQVTEEGDEPVWRDLLVKVVENA